MRDPEFPTRFPIFPLPNVVLFPGTVLPLHVFEPRYRAMAGDAIDGDRVIGVVLIESGGDPMEACAPVFPVGCAGRMSEIQSLPDGRYFFLLTGERRFEITSEVLNPGGYRIAEARLWDEADFAELAASDRSALDAGRSDLEARILDIVRLQSPDDVEALRERLAALDPLQLIRELAFGLSSEAVAKQPVLEARSPREELALLTQLVDFLVAEARLPRAPRSIN